MSDEVSNFYREHCASANGVVALFTEEVLIGIFSSLEAAEKYRKNEAPEGDCCFAPFVIDVPEYGNVVSTKQN